MAAEPAVNTGVGGSRVMIAVPSPVRSGTGKKARRKSTTEEQALLVDVMKHEADAQFCLAMLGVFLMVIQNECAWMWNTTVRGGDYCSPSVDPTCDPRTQAAFYPPTVGLLSLNVLRGFISATTLACILVTFRYYGHLVAFKQSKNLLPPSATVMNSALRGQFLLESLILIIHVFPGIEDVSPLPSFYLSFNVLMFLRIWYLGRLVKYHSHLYSSNGRFIGALTNVEFTSAFIFKTAVKGRPAVSIVIALVSLLAAVSYSLRLIESVLCAYNMSLQCMPMPMRDAVWLLITTMLTLGYGDVVPSTDGGRLFTLLGAISGALLTAITVALTKDHLGLSRSEAKVVSFLKKDANRKRVQHAGAATIQAVYRYYLTKIKWKHHGHANPDAALNKVFRVLEKFRNTKRWVSANDPVDATDKQITLLEALEVNLTDVRGNLNALYEYFAEVEEVGTSARDGDGERALPSVPSGSERDVDVAMPLPVVPETPPRASGPGVSRGSSLRNMIAARDVAVGPSPQDAAAAEGHAAAAAPPAAAAAAVAHSSKTKTKTPAAAAAAGPGAAAAAPAVTAAEGAVSAEAAAAAAEAALAPMWALQLRDIVELLGVKVGGLAADIARLKAAAAAGHASRTRRLAAIE